MIRNKKGFTLMDTMVAVALVSLVALGAFNILVFIRVNGAKRLNSIDNLLDQTIGDRFLYHDFKNAAPSFNNLQDLDKDDDGRNFFDLNTSYPVALRTTGKTRTLTLKPGGKTEFFLLMAKVNVGPPRYIDPVRLYQVSKATLVADGTLTYVGPANNNYFSKLNSRSLFDYTDPPVTTAANQQFFVNNSILYFYAPSTARDSSKAADGFYQNYGFFGRVVGGDLVHETFGGRIKTVHEDGSPVTSLDDYLRRLPVGNGSIPIVSARPVEFIRYYLDKSPAHPGEWALFNQKWNGAQGRFDSDQMIADMINDKDEIKENIGVILKRLSVSDMAISFKINLKQGN